MRHGIQGEAMQQKFVLIVEDDEMIMNMITDEFIGVSP